ncbi:MAG TPA: hypothetical protein VIK77_02845 [Tissierellaceae bacterium]
MSKPFSRIRDNMHRKKGSVGKYKVDKGFRDFCAFYFNSGKLDLKYNYDTLKGFFLDFMRELMDIPIQTGEPINIPHLGMFLVISKENPVYSTSKKAFKYIDWKSTLELWEVIHKDKTKEEIMAMPSKERKYVYHHNDGSYGAKLSYYWMSTWHSLARSCYKFLPVSRLKASVGAKMRSNPEGIIYPTKDLLNIRFPRKRV